MIMYVHVFSGQTNYSWSLLNMLESEVDLQDHIFIFGLGKDHPMEFVYSGQMQKQLLFLKNPAHIGKILRLIFRAKWIYIHLLAYDPTLFFWYLNRKLLKRTTWIGWGSDIYAFQKKSQSLRTRTYEWLRCRIIPVFPEIAAFVPEDFQVIASVYGSHATYIPILYPLPVDPDQLDQVTVKPDRASVNVMIGNSGDPTNNHLQMIDLLACFRHENMKVVCPLAYGGTDEYRQLVISEGNRTFGNNFIPWLDMKDRQAYAGQLADVDVALMNHKRQQGLGNILALLYLGKKVFVRSDTSSYSFLRNNGCLVYGTESIRGMNFEEFRREIPEKKVIISNVKKILSRDYSAGLWKHLIQLH